MAIEKRYRITCGGEDSSVPGFFELTPGYDDKDGDGLVLTAGFANSRQPEDENVVLWLTRQEALELAAGLYATLEIPLTNEQTALLG